MSKDIISHFKKADPKFHQVLLKVHALHGDKLFELKKNDFLFDRLIESIISQQLSVRVADVIYDRVLNLIPDKKFTPESILKLNDEILRKAGMSYGKIKYIKDLSSKVKSGELDLDNLENLENAQVIEQLTKVKGIGKWTAEMFLMSALGRPDIFSHGDLGLKNAIKKIYNLEKYDEVEVEKIVIKWSPFRTHAARILWKSLELK
jgi:DNA-3-methyladenine glycosylase II